MIKRNCFSSSDAAGRIPRIYLHYAEMSRERQYRCESRVILALEALSKELPKLYLLSKGEDIDTRFVSANAKKMIEELK